MKDGQYRVDGPRAFHNWIAHGAWKLGPHNGPTALRIFLSRVKLAALKARTDAARIRLIDLEIAIGHYMRVQGL